MDCLLERYSHLQLLNQLMPSPYQQPGLTSTPFARRSPSKGNPRLSGHMGFDPNLDLCLATGIVNLGHSEGNGLALVHQARLQFQTETERRAASAFAGFGALGGFEDMTSRRISAGLHLRKGNKETTASGSAFSDIDNSQRGSFFVLSDTSASLTDDIREEEDAGLAEAASPTFELDGVTRQTERFPLPPSRRAKIASDESAVTKVPLASDSPSSIPSPARYTSRDYDDMLLDAIDASTAHFLPASSLRSRMEWYAPLSTSTLRFPCSDAQDQVRAESTSAQEQAHALHDARRMGSKESNNSNTSSLSGMKRLSLTLRDSFVRNSPQSLHNLLSLPTDSRRRSGSGEPQPPTLCAAHLTVATGRPRSNTTPVRPKGTLNWATPFFDVIHEEHGSVAPRIGINDGGVTNERMILASPVQPAASTLRARRLNLYEPGGSPTAQLARSSSLLLGSPATPASGLSHGLRSVTTSALAPARVPAQVHTLEQEQQLKLPPTPLGTPFWANDDLSRILSQYSSSYLSSQSKTPRAAATTAPSKLRTKISPAQSREDGDNRWSAEQFSRQTHYTLGSCCESTDGEDDISGGGRTDGNRRPTRQTHRCCTSSLSPFSSLAFGSVSRCDGHAKRLPYAPGGMSARPRFESSCSHVSVSFFSSSAVRHKRDARQSRESSTSIWSLSRSKGHGLSFSSSSSPGIPAFVTDSEGSADGLTPSEMRRRRESIIRNGPRPSSSGDGRAPLWSLGRKGRQVQLDAAQLSIHTNC
ncbi:hypothetical protein K437DRAFT_265686 [Tilletiaria anomala UBC 951]|uniref:Uncharacterized protein n=1 Tax=Tilletiaria anomala (strain ATCC 24038 / CBS 436.72 / UBC 951) TaxID=1037660 RepID=A0A066WSH4_TILAU|nr:uncharacterized protein K437DRAFT_265686 [Tilletiaria anomala UBC 951]KDN53635.1 hypothetical protein K437DRAFT_265686 [Tilletiaria anomala UBC 951]